MHLEFTRYPNAVCRGDLSVSLGLGERGGGLEVGQIRRPVSVVRWGGGGGGQEGKEEVLVAGVSV